VWSPTRTESTNGKTVFCATQGGRGPRPAMQLTNYISKNRILSDLKATTKDDALTELGALLAGDAGPDLTRSIVEVLQQREELASTGIGDHIAIPHGKLDAVKDLTMAVARSPRGIDFSSVDGKPSHLFFVLVAPQSETEIHLKALARISRLCRESDLPERLMKAEDATEMFDIILEEDGRLWAS